jgi:hypothetical protein
MRCTRLNLPNAWLARSRLPGAAILAFRQARSRATL